MLGSGRVDSLTHPLTPSSFSLSVDIKKASGGGRPGELAAGRRADDQRSGGRASEQHPRSAVTPARVCAELEPEPSRSQRLRSAPPGRNRPCPPAAAAAAARPPAAAEALAVPGKFEARPGRPLAPGLPPLPVDSWGASVGRRVLGAFSFKGPLGLGEPGERPATGLRCAPGGGRGPRPRRPANAWLRRARLG